MRPILHGRNGRVSAARTSFVHLVNLGNRSATNRQPLCSASPAMTHAMSTAVSGQNITQNTDDGRASVSLPNVPSPLPSGSSLLSWFAYSVSLNGMRIGVSR